MQARQASSEGAAEGRAAARAFPRCLGPTAAPPSLRGDGGPPPEPSCARHRDTESGGEAARGGVGCAASLIRSSWCVPCVPCTRSRYEARQGGGGRWEAPGGGQGHPPPFLPCRDMDAFHTYTIQRITHNCDVYAYKSAHICDVRRPGPRTGRGGLRGGGGGGGGGLRRRRIRKSDLRGGSAMRHAARELIHTATRTHAAPHRHPVGRLHRTSPLIQQDSLSCKNPAASRASRPAHTTEHSFDTASIHLQFSTAPSSPAGRTRPGPAGLLGRGWRSRPPIARATTRPRPPSSQAAAARRSCRRRPGTHTRTRAHTLRFTHGRGRGGGGGAQGTACGRIRLLTARRRAGSRRQVRQLPARRRARVRRLAEFRNRPHLQAPLPAHASDDAQARA